MNTETFKGQWKVLKGKVKQQWGKLTDDEIIQIDGKADELSGLLQKKYGYAKDQAEREIDSFTKNYSTTTGTTEKEYR